jgi:hypothetical protein
MVYHRAEFHLNRGRTHAKVVSSSSPISIIIRVIFLHAGKSVYRRIMGEFPLICSVPVKQSKTYAFTDESIVAPLNHPPAITP